MLGSLAAARRAPKTPHVLQGGPVFGHVPFNGRQHASTGINAYSTPPYSPICRSRRTCEGAISRGDGPPAGRKERISAVRPAPRASREDRRSGDNSNRGRHVTIGYRGKRGFVTAWQRRRGGRAVRFSDPRPSGSDSVLSIVTRRKIAPTEAGRKDHVGPCAARRAGFFGWTGGPGYGLFKSHHPRRFPVTYRRPADLEW